MFKYNKRILMREKSSAVDYPNRILVDFLRVTKLIHQFKLIIFYIKLKLLSTRRIMQLIFVVL